MRGSNSIEAMRGSIQQSIFNALGPNGAKMLKLNPLFHDDPNVANSQEVADYRDVEVTLPNPAITPPADLELGINLNLAGSDKLDVDFDLGVDSLAFGLETRGGVEVSFGYNFSFGFGVNLRKGFFFQLNPNVNYDSQGLVIPGLHGDWFVPGCHPQAGTTLAGKLFILNVSATSNSIEDYNRDGILNNDLSNTDVNTGLSQGPKLNEAIDGVDYNRDGDMNDVLIEVDSDGDGRLSKGTGLSGNIFIDIHNPDGELDPKHRLYLGEIRGTPVKQLFNAGITPKPMQT